MNPEKRKKIEAAGHTVMTVEDFLGLTPAEAALVEARLALADAVRSARESAGLSQGQLAKRVGTTQSRISKVESADAGVSTDLMLKAIFGAGATPANVLSRKVARHEPLDVKRGSGEVAS